MPNLNRVTNVVCLIVCCGALLTPSAAALAANFTWTGATANDDWDAFVGISNWNTGGNFTLIPDSNDTVLFDSNLAGPILVDLNGTRRVISATLQGGNPITLTGAFDTLELTSGDITASAFSNGYTIQSRVTLLGTANWDVSQTGSAPGLTVSGMVSGSPSLTKTGSGTLVLSGNNTYTGTTTVSSGELQIGNGGSSGSIIGNLVNNATATFDRSGILIYNGFISGSGSLNKEGTGLLTLTANSSFSGTTTINGGTLQIGSGGSSGSLVGDIINNGSLTFNRSNTSTYPGVISGGGSFTKQGSGTLTLSGNNLFASTANINGGTLQVGGGGTTGSLAGNVAINSGTLAFNRSDDFSYFGNISGGGLLTKSGSGTLSLFGNNTYFGGTDLANGILSISADTNLGSAGGDVRAEGGNLRVTATHTTSRDIVLDNEMGIEVVGGVTYTAGGLLGSTEALTKSGAGTLILTGANVDVNDKMIDGGTLQVGNGGTAGTLTGNVLNNATLAFNRSDDIVYGGVISGAGQLLKQGAGKLTLSGNNTYAGDTSVNEGTIQISADANLGTGGSVTLTDAALQTTATHGTTRDFSLQGTATVDVNPGVTYTINGQVGASGGLEKTGDGTLALDGINTYTGGTNVTAGTLLIDDTAALGTGQLDLSNANLDVSGDAVFGIPGMTAPSVVSVAAGGIVSTAAGDDTTIGLAGDVVLASGTINTRRLNAMFGGRLSGTGTVNARILADTGSEITATGNLDLGDAATLDGFYSNGELAVVSGTTTLHDANTAVFDSAALVTLGDGLGSSATLAAAGGLTLDFGGNISGFGTLDTPNDAPNPLINNGHIAGNSGAEPITLLGYVKGVGTFADVVFSGTFAPGFSPAEVHISGGVAFAGSAAFQAELGGTTPGTDHDQVNATGGATLGGELEVALINAFVPTPGDSFEIMTFVSRTGAFTTVTGDVGLLDPVTFLLPLYSDTNLRLFTAIPGDGNLSGAVEAGDYTIWANEFGAGDEFTEGDYNGDGVVGPADYTLWANNFGLRVSAPDGSAGSLSEPVALSDENSLLDKPAVAPSMEHVALNAVPEPSTLVLAALGLLAFLLARGRDV